MEGPTPDWANVDDYATLEEVFESPDFGHPLPAAAATAGLGAALASTPGTHLLRNRAIALTSVLAASLSVVLGLLFTGPASTPVLTAQHAPPARAGHGAGPVPVASPTPPAGRAGATTAPTTPPSPSNLGGSQLASSSSSPGRGQNTTLGYRRPNGAAPATPAPTATLTVLTNNPPAPITPIRAHAVDGVDDHDHDDDHGASAAHHQHPHPHDQSAPAADHHDDAAVEEFPRWSVGRERTWEWQQWRQPGM